MKLLRILPVLMCLSLAAPRLAHANAGLIVQGFTRTLVSVFQIPISMVEDSTKVIFPVGLVSGAVKGSFKTVIGVLHGGLEMAQGAAPYAKYALLL